MSGDNHYRTNTGQVRNLVLGIAIVVFILYTLSGIQPPAHPKPPSLPPGVNTYRNYVDHPQEAQEHLNRLARHCSLAFFESAYNSFRSHCEAVERIIANSAIRILDSREMPCRK